MNRKLGIAAGALAVGLAAVLLAFTFAVDRGASEREVASAASFSGLGSATMPPVTESPNWRRLGEDVGVLLREDPDLGIRGTLYLRIDGDWKPVAIDGTDDLSGVLPAR